MNSKYPLYIPNRASELRVTSSKKKLSSNGRRSSRSRSRRVLSAPGVGLSAKTNNTPKQFEEIQMHYGEKPKSPDCSKLSETVSSLESELINATKTIDKKDVEIKKLKTEKKKLMDKVNECNSRFGEVEANRLTTEMKKVPHNANKFKTRNTRKSHSPDDTDTESVEDFLLDSMPDYNKQLIDAVNDANVEAVKKISEDKTAIANLTDTFLTESENTVLSKINQRNNMLKYSQISNYLIDIRKQKNAKGGKTKKGKYGLIKIIHKKRTFKGGRR